MTIPATWYEGRNPRKYHYVTEIEDDGETFVISKYYGRYKQWWHYEIESRESVETRFRIGLYRETRRND